MSIDRDTVARIADLARLRLTAEELDRAALELSRILDLVEQMDAVDTSAVEPLAHPLDRPLRLRPDEITETDRRDDFQALAPETAEGLYLVPRVVE